MKNAPKRILGIDPGSHNLGLGLVRKQGSSVRLLYTDVISAPRTKGLHERLEYLSEKTRELINKLEPEEIAIEDIFVGRNVKSAFHLGLAKGVVLASCFGKGIEIFEYAPTHIKSVVTGHGRADKDQVKKMVELLVGKKILLKHDATDAIAVAICHASTIRFN